MGIVVIYCDLESLTTTRRLYCEVIEFYELLRDELLFWQINFMQNCEYCLVTFFPTAGKSPYFRYPF